MRRQTWLAIAAALALAACDGETTEADAGSDAGTTPTTDAGGRDAGRDAGPDDEDGGTDAGTVVADGGADGGSTDPDGGTIMVGDCTGAPVSVIADCPDFTACGGEIAEDDYCYTGVCIEEDTIIGPARTQSGCATARLEDAGGTIAGQVSFLPGGQVSRETVTHVEATIVFPSACTLIVFGCTAIGAQIEDGIPGSSASCTVVSGECRCDIAIDSSVDTTEGYVASAGTLTVGAGSTERTYDYCVDETDGSLRFVETTEDGTLEPGIQSIAPAPAP